MIYYAYLTYLYHRYEKLIIHKSWSFLQGKNSKKLKNLKNLVLSTALISAG
jgi:hypothetical protein